MTQAGTMGLGGSAQSKQSGSPWAAIALTLAVVVAMIGAVWLASNAGLVGGTAAKPVADGSYDAIEAQRGAITSGTLHPGKVADDLVLAPTLATSQAATQYSVSRIAFSMTVGTFHPGKVADDLVLAPTLATSQAATQYSVSRLAFGMTVGTFHPGKAADDLVLAPVPVPLSPTSGTFHAGKAADDQVVAPVDRPGVSGP